MRMVDLTISLFARFHVNGQREDILSFFEQYSLSKKLQCRQGLEQNRECGQVFEVIMVFVELSIIPQCVNVSS